MWFVVLGVLMMLGNWLDIGPTAGWSWAFTGDLWKFCVPFALAAGWWGWADATGRNKRIEMEKLDAKRQERRERNLESLGMDAHARRKKKAAR